MRATRMSEPWTNSLSPLFVVVYPLLFILYNAAVFLIS